MGPVSAPMAREGLRPGFNERKSQWLLMPDGKQYLVPIIQRHQKIVPMFGANGAVDVKVESPEGELPKLVDEFYELLAQVTDGEITLGTLDAFSSLMRLVRALLLFNYDLSDSRIAEILTMDKNQLEILFNSLVRLLVQNN